MYNNPRSQQGEISHQATVVIQCTHDKRDITDRMLVEKDNTDKYLVYGKPTLDLATCRIDRGDLVFSIGTSAVPRGNILNSAPPVTSFLNGMYWRKTNSMPALTNEALTEKFTAAKISESIRFMGVSLGNTVPNPDDDSQQKTQITVRTQGTMAIHHNGPSNLHPGDTLLWKVPISADYVDTTNHKRHGRFGRSNVKQTLMTIPMRKEHGTLAETLKKKFTTDPNNLRNENHFEVDKFADCIRQVMTAMYMLGKDTESLQILDTLDPESDKFGGENGEVKTYMKQVGDLVKNNKSVSDLLEKCTTGFMNLMLDIERRKIGKVLSYARPGEKVDVNLGSG